jgi:hypothetical protein
VKKVQKKGKGKGKNKGSKSSAEAAASLDMVSVFFFTNRTLALKETMNSTKYLKK